MESAERKQRTLGALLASNKISSATYDSVNGGFVKIIENMRALKEILKQHEDLWKSRLDEQIKVLEMVLAGLEFRYLSGEFNAEEWERMKLILTSGLDSIRAMETSGINPPSRPDPPSPPKPVLEKEKIQLEDASKSSFVEGNVVKIGAVDYFKGIQGNNPEKTNPSRSGTQGMNRGRPSKSRLDLRDDPLFERRCRNPWNSDCTNTDIELSIYYDGEFLPICHRCWREISEKNLEWSTL